MKTRRPLFLVTLCLLGIVSTGCIFHGHGYGYGHGDGHGRGRGRGRGRGGHHLQVHLDGPEHVLDANRP